MALVGDFLATDFFRRAPFGAAFVLFVFVGFGFEAARSLFARAEVFFFMDVR